MLPQRLLRASLVCLSLSPLAHARDMAPPLASERAVQLGHAAVQAYDRGDWEAALEGFREADALTHSPVFELYIARCERNAGRWRAARESYARLNVEVEPGAPTVWDEAIRQAQREGLELAARIPSVMLELASGDARELQRVRVVLDGEPIRIGPREPARELDPGAHVLEIELDGARSLSQIFMLEGERGRRVLLRTPRLTPPPGASAQRGPPAPTPLDATTAERSDLPGTLAWVHFAIGGAALATGLTTGLLTMTRSARVQRDCPDGRCPRGALDSLESARALGMVTDIAFAVGLANVASGLVLTFWHEARPEAAGHTATGLSISGYLPHEL